VRAYFESSLFWWPAVLRLCLFSIMTSGGVLLSQLNGKSTEDFAKFGWVEWTMFWGPVIAAWIGTKIAFLDQTMGKLRQEKSETQVWQKGQTI
jgi:hypothetical protein